MRAADPERDDQEQLDSLVLAYDASLSQDTPNSLDADSLSAPLAAKLRAAQATIEMLERARLGGVSGDSLCGPSLPGTPVSLGRRVASIGAAGQMIGRFEIVRELGRGGFGVVFLAVDTTVGRQVALKVPRPEVLISDETRARFLREAQAAGALEHPNLIAVYEVGEDGPLCYIASSFCDGPNLAQWLAMTSRRLGQQEAATFVELLARAVDHAHRRGVLHRDIKPSNILLERLPETRISDSAAQLTDMAPKLADFGLAKLAEYADNETRSGTLLGTPAYMAPEQAQGRTRDTGPATDVYALGVILYELLAGQPPFRGESDVQTLLLVSQCEVPRITKHRAGVARDLEAIVLKCLERDAARRYPSAADLADDLGRYLAGDSTLARPTGVIVRVARWVKRRKAIATLAAIVLATSLALTGGAWWYSGKLSGALARVEATQREHRQTLYVSAVARAERALATNQDLQALAQLKEARGLAADEDPRDFAWHHLWKRLHEYDRVFTGHSQEVYCVRYSHQGRFLATGSKDSTARIWDIASGDCVHLLPGHSNEVNCIAFSSDDSLLATSDDSGEVRIWNTASGEEVRRLPAHQGKAFGVAFSPKDHLLATCGEDAKTQLWDTQSWQNIATLAGHTNLVGSVAFSLDGERLATASDDRLVIVWNVASREKQFELKHLSPVSCVQFNRSGTLLVTAARTDREAWVWDAQTGTKIASSAIYPQVIHGVAFDQSGERFALATKDGTVELLQARTMQSIRRIHGHDRRVWSVAFSPDGQQLATAGADNTIKLWSVERDSIPQPDDKTQTLLTLGTSADNRTLVTANQNGDLDVRDLTTQRVLKQILRDRDVVGDFDGDGKLDTGIYAAGEWRLRLSSARDDEAELIRYFGTERDIPVVGDWDNDKRDDLAVFRYPDQWFIERDGVAAYTKFGMVPEDAPRVVPIAGRWGSFRERVGVAYFHRSRARWVFQLSHGTEVSNVVTDNNELHATPLGGRWHSGRGDVIGLWHDTRIWAEPLSCKSQTAAVTLARKKKLNIWSELRPAKTTDLTNANADPRILDAALDRSRYNGAVSEVIALAVSPRGERVASSSRLDPRVKIWDVASGRRAGTIRLDDSYVTAVAYSPDGETLAVTGREGQLGLYYAESLQPRRIVQAHKGALRCLAYSRNGELLATATDEGIIGIWTADGEPRLTLSEKPYEIYAIEISPDNRVLAAVGSNRLVTLWSLESGRKIASLAGHQAALDGLAISPDGRTLATGCDRGTIKLWDLATQLELYTIAQLAAPIRKLAFSPDGQHLFATSGRTLNDKVLHSWSAVPPPPTAQD